MNWNQWIRQIHRWIAIIFTLLVVLVTIASLGEEPAEWVYLSPLPALFLLLFTGLYLFVLPHASRWRNARGNK